MPTIQGKPSFVKSQALSSVDWLSRQRGKNNCLRARATSTSSSIYIFTSS